MRYFNYLCLLVILIDVAHSSTETEKSQDDNLADEAHSLLSTGLFKFSNRIDSFFGNTRGDDARNGSTVRFSTTTIFNEDGTQTEGDIRINLVLPRAQDRLNLNASNEKDETKTKNKKSSEKSQENTSTDEGPGVLERLGNAAFYFLDAAKIKFNSDIGIRVNWPPQVFARARFRRPVHWAVWSALPTQEITWVDREGLSTKTQIPFDRRLSDHLLFRLVNTIDWDDDTYLVTFTNGPTMFQTIDDKKALQYSFYVISVNTPAYRVENYKFDITFRQLLYKKWFFWELGPTLDFHREKNFRRDPSFHVTFEVVIGNI